MTNQAAMKALGFVSMAKPTSLVPQDDGFRTARARLGGLTLHGKYPYMAKDAGRKGGQATSSKFVGGKRAWAVAMAMKRWHKTPFNYRESRAPKAGSGEKAAGNSQPDPAPALTKRRRRTATQPDSEQLKLF
jgi:hypothetical protein